MLAFVNFNVVAEHLVVADFQRGDAGAFPLALLHGRDDLASMAGDFAQFVEFGVEAARMTPGLFKTAGGSSAMPARAMVSRTSTSSIQLLAQEARRVGRWAICRLGDAVSSS